MSQRVPACPLGPAVMEWPSVPSGPPDPSCPSVAMANCRGGGHMLLWGCNQGLWQHWPFRVSKCGIHTNSPFPEAAAKFTKRERKQTSNHF